jgi:UDP-N-acetylmuramoyl-tripeptide--D-alanyl-D-alanine ligase
MVAGATAAGARHGEGAFAVPDRAAALDLLTEVLVPGDVVLVKASRSNGLEVLAAGLLAVPGDTADADGAGA